MVHLPNQKVNAESEGTDAEVRTRDLGMWRRNGGKCSGTAPCDP
jgi:hypothetical protein